MTSLICATIIRGGPAYDLKARLPFTDNGDRIMPDYELYREKFPKIDYAM